jgi:DNA repair protein SbcD/Mre11
MPSVKFIHTADLHLDTPFKGLSNLNSELADKLKDATFKSFKKIIDLCIENKVDFLIISGDIFDSENKSLKAQREFIFEITRLSNHGIHTYFNCGNHDLLNSWLDILQLPDKVYRFGCDNVESVNYTKNGIPVADIYGISFEKKEVRKNTAVKYKLNNNPSPISIAVHHGTIGNAGPHENYAPFKIEDIVKEKFDYWALGHIHKRQVIHETEPMIVYPGNPQGRDFGESGAKGCYIIEIESGHKPIAEFIPTQLIRFEIINIDLKDETTINELSKKIEEAPKVIDNYEENVSYILRIVLTGRTLLHKHLIKHGELYELIKSFNDGQLLQLNFIWIDRIDLKTQSVIPIEEIKNRNDFPADVLKIFDEYENDPQELSQLIENAGSDFLNPSAKRELAIPFSRVDQKEILEKAKWILLDELIKE